MNDITKLLEELKEVIGTHEERHFNAAISPSGMGLAAKIDSILSKYPTAPVPSKEHDSFVCPACGLDFRIIDAAIPTGNLTLDALVKKLQKQLPFECPCQEVKDVRAVPSKSESGLRQEIADLVWSNTNPNEEIWKRKIRVILSRHPTPSQEPLACLAVRKGCQLAWCGTYKSDPLMWSVEIQTPKKTEVFNAPTYEATELNARQYLEGLGDKK